MLSCEPTQPTAIIYTWGPVYVELHSIQLSNVRIYLAYQEKNISLYFQKLSIIAKPKRIKQSSGQFFMLSATTLVSERNTGVFRTALTALTEPLSLSRRITHYLLPRRRVTFHMYFFILCWRLCTMRMTRVLHSLQGLQLCWSHLHNAWRCWIIATTYHSTIFKTYAFSLYFHLSIYVSI